MFVFNSSHGNNYDPISNFDQNDPIYLQFLPSIPIEDDHNFLQQLHNDLFMGADGSSTATHHMVEVVDHSDLKTYKDTNAPINPLMEQKIQRSKRSSKRDRHSKINTARGLRDRRMRLSLPVAREFFSLQDMLGVDKGSKTVEWLLLQANSEINELKKQLNYKSTSFETHMMSKIDQVLSNCNQSGNKASGKEKKTRKPQKSSALDRLERESREKARAMARERARTRTWEKMKIRRLLADDYESRPHGDATNNALISKSAIVETGEEYGIYSHNINRSSETITKLDESTRSHQIDGKLVINEHIIDDSLAMIMSKWSPSRIFSSL